MLGADWSVLPPQVHRSGEGGRVKRKFSSFFKSLVIELDKDLYGPDNHLVEVCGTTRYMHLKIDLDETAGSQKLSCVDMVTTCKKPVMVTVYRHVYHVLSWLLHVVMVTVCCQWHRNSGTQETDGFQVKRPGDQNVKCTVLLMLDYQVRYLTLTRRDI